MTTSAMSSDQKALLVEMKRAGVVLFGKEIRERYGLGPPIYLDLRDNLYERADLMWRIGGEFSRLIRALAASSSSTQGVVGVPDTATPLALATALFSWQEGMQPALRYLLLRQAGKVYGSAAPSFLIGKKDSAECEYNLIDDVIASGLSKWKALEKLKGEGVRVGRIVAFLDRQQGGTELLQQEGYRVDSVFRLLDVVDFYYQEGLIDSATHGRIHDFIASHRFAKPLWQTR